MSDAIVYLEDVTVAYDGFKALDRLNFFMDRRELRVVIGPNGAGKTTLVGQLTGNLAPDSGTIRFAGRDVTRLPTDARVRLGLGRSFQITSVLREFSALDNVALAVQAHDGHSFRFLRDVRKDRKLLDAAQRGLEAVGLGARANADAAALSHGEQRQLEIAMALAGEPRLLLLDEPMAGMGVEESQRLVAFLHGLKSRCGMLLIEHDMDAVFALADRITVLVYGRVLASGTPDEIRAHPEVRQAYLGEETARC